LDSNNSIRKQGELKLNELKQNDVDKYACYLTMAIGARKFISH